MPIPNNLNQAMDSIDTATNEVAQEVTDLRSLISTRMSDEEVASVQARMSGVSDRLRSIAANPNDPVPIPPENFAARVRGQKRQ